MVTSRLSKRKQKCIGGVFLYSGRPNPTWKISEDAIMQLMTIWNALTRIRNGHQPAPKLGYQGCFLRCPNNEEWIAFEGVVTLRKFDVSEHRRDEERRFEKTLLSSAPKSVLPPSFSELNSLP